MTNEEFTASDEIKEIVTEAIDTFLFTGEHKLEERMAFVNVLTNMMEKYKLEKERIIEYKVECAVDDPDTEKTKVDVYFKTDELSEAIKLSCIFFKGDNIDYLGDLDFPAPNHYDPDKRGFDPK